MEPCIHGYWYVWSVGQGLDLLWILKDTDPLWKPRCYGLWNYLH